MAKSRSCEIKHHSSYIAVNFKTRSRKTETSLRSVVLHLVLRVEISSKETLLIYTFSNRLPHNPPHPHYFPRKMAMKARSASSALRAFRVSFHLKNCNRNHSADFIYHSLLRCALPLFQLTAIMRLHQNQTSRPPSKRLFPPSVNS
jgi:hypothetical protein